MPKIDHLTIAVSDWRASRDWYTSQLGLTPEFDAANGGPAGLGVAAVQDESGLTLFLEQVAAPVSPCGCVITVQVDDVDAKSASLAASGVQFRRTPQKLFWGYGAEIVDPDGHVIALWDEMSMRAKGGS